MNQIKKARGPRIAYPCYIVDFLHTLGAYTQIVISLS